jgi:ubiquitin carboxyl-terminal hydrolase 25
MLMKRTLPMNPLELLSTARSYLGRFSASNGVDEAVPTELLDGLSLYESQLSNQLGKLESDAETLKSKLKQQFTDRRHYGYRLHSVFIHRGDVTHGHYWIYIYDFAGNRWFKYNDESVTEVDEKVVFANDSAEGAGPYFLTYVKEDMAHELVEVLKRDLDGNLMRF